MISAYSGGANWYDDAHPPTEEGLYYSETCDDCGNPQPGLCLLGKGNMQVSPRPFKAFGPIPGAMQTWPMTMKQE